MTLVADFNSSVNVPFQRMRQALLDGALQEGVVGANDFKVVQRGAGANQSVDVGTGFAWVQIDTGTRNGMGHVTNDATANVTVTASNATNPRVDQIILRWNDSSIPTGSGNVPTLEVLTGTATAGATLDNRTGAVALPNDCLRLADILVPATSTSVVTANIRDRRPWARGAYFTAVRASTNATTTSASHVLVDATNLQPRIECSGVPMRATLRSAIIHTVAGSTIAMTTYLDGTTGTNVLGAGAAIVHVAQTTNQQIYTWVWDFTPPAGSHLIGPAWSTSAATATLAALATQPLQYVVEEIVRPNTSNT
jgi:hypothetical protein